MTQPIDGRPVPGPRLRTALPLLAVGIVLAVAGLVVAGLRIWDYLDTPSHPVPGTITMKLDSGEYRIFDRSSELRAIRASDVTVTGSGGVEVPTYATSRTETIGQSGTSYTSVVGFDVPSAGSYTISVDSDVRSEVVVARPFSRVASDNVGWILLFMLGGLLGLIAFVMLLVGIVRRSRARKEAAAAGVGYGGGYGTAAGYGTGYGTGTPPASTPAPPSPTPVVAPVPPPSEVTVPAPEAPPVAPALPPADWYPDPSGEHRLRYWDGTAWTDHTAD